MNNILLYYDINTAKEISDCTYYYNGKRLIIYELKDNESLNYSLFRYPFSIPILNIFGSYYTDFDNRRYVLFSSFFEINRKVSFKDILYLSNINRINYYIDYYLLWKNKINKIRYYYDNNSFLYEYFYSLALDVLQIAKTIDYNNISYGYCLKRITDLINVDNFYNNFNIKVGAVVSNISLYIKYLSFYDKQFDIDCNTFFYNSYSKDDLSFLFCRLLFPNYYFDYKFDDIYCLFINYLQCLNKIKIRQNNLSLFKYIINLFL